MGGLDKVKWLCCTWDGVAKLQRITALIVGVLIIVSAVLSLLANLVDPLKLIRSVWNIMFGVIMILVQLNWKKMILRNFGFLKHWVMRGFFYIFVGSNIMTTEGKALEVIFSFAAGGACVFVGVVELAFGCKMAPEDEQEEGDAESGKKKKAKDKNNAVEPTLTVNVGGSSIGVTPAQAAQGAGWAARAAACSGAAASGSGGGGGGGGDNPFFGNQHLNQS